MVMHAIYQPELKPETYANFQREARYANLILWSYHELISMQQLYAIYII